MSQFTYLIVGADGTLGKSLGSYLRSSAEVAVVETTRRRKTLGGSRIYLDLKRDVSAWDAPDSISRAFLCAAVTSLDECRRHPAETERINVISTVTLTNYLVQMGAFVLFPSTNLVFDGTTPFTERNAEPKPECEYGRQKARVEGHLLSLANSVAIVRFTKVLSPQMPLIQGWIEQLKTNRPIRPFSDMVLSPVPLSFAVETLCRIAKQRSPGIWQVSGDRDITYEQLARYIAKKLGAEESLVQPISVKDSALSLEAVPKHTTLDTRRLQEEHGVSVPDVWKAIDEVFALSFLS